MITPRQTRLFRVTNLRAFQRAIRLLAGHQDLSRLRSCAVIVPSAAAADALRRTLESHALQSKAQTDRALCLPQIVTRAGWYDQMRSRLAASPRRLSDLEREVLLKAAARGVSDSGIGAPFRLRAGLLIEMLGFYDDLRRRDVPIDTFERLLAGDLERDAPIDRGAERLLRQTRFLAAAFRGYEARLAATGAVDEHALRAELLRAEPARPLRHVIVTIGDRTCDGAGLWPADFDLLARIPLLEQVDIVATQATIAAGFLDRLQKFMPGFEEAEGPSDHAPLDVAGPPVLTTESDGRPFVVSRDREDELSVVAERLKNTGPSPAGGVALERRAVVFRRPLPYVYLARDVFTGAGIPYQTFDALPLAAEPYAAALDLVFEFVTSEFTRGSVVALLASPHFQFEGDGTRVGRLDVDALNRACSETGYFGGLDRLHEMAESLPGRARSAARVAAGAANELKALADIERPSVQLAALLAFLGAHDRIPPVTDPLRERHLRARRAILSAIRDLRRAHEQLDDSPVRLTEIAAMIRRWIEGQTFAPRAGTSGVHVLDAQAARYGEFDEMFVVGLIEGEWPQRPARSIFYPQSLLAQLDWPDSRAMLAGERAAFQDLVGLARRQVHLSTFELEADSIVSPSVFLEDVDRLGLRSVEAPDEPAGRIFVHEALTTEPTAPAAITGNAATWLEMRTRRTAASDTQFHGAGAPYRPAAHTVSSLERYLECPFRYFADRVLELKEDPEDEATLTPRELGIFVHDVFRVFFDDWNRRGRGAITPGNLDEARAVFREVVEPLLARLPDDEAAVQRTRLLGSAADEGIAEAVFQIEAEWPTPVVERLLEHPLVGEFEIRAEEETRRVNLRGKADRIDLLEDGTFRIIDYKLGHAPKPQLALQLPVYSICAAQQLRERTGKPWEPGQAGYIAFGGDRRFVPMLGRGKEKEPMLRNAQTRLLATIDAIERGEFPPKPDEVRLCDRCAHATVCRKDYVGDV